LIVFSAEYKSRSNVDHITAQIEGATIDAQSDIRLLAALFEGPRSPRGSDLNRVKDFGYQFYKHEKTFQKLLAQIKGLEDWSKLSVKVPALDTMAPRGSLSPGGKKVSFESSASGGSRSAPPSPYQATVEDETDTDDPDYHTGENHFQDDPPLFPRRMSRDSQHDTTPPKVFIRSPTDPKTMESEMRALNFDSPTFDEHHGHEQKPATSSASPQLRGRGSPTARESTPIDSSTQSLSGTSQKPRSRSQIEAELRRLTAEIEQLKEPSDSGSSSWSRHSPSHSIDSTPKPNAFMRLPQQQRARANTAGSADLRPTMKMGDQGTSDLPKFGRPPHVSPRFSPLTPTSPMSPPEGSREGERRGKKTREYRESIYGADPHASLPTVLETGQRPEGRPSMGRNKRASWAAEDFGQFFNQSYGGADPPLFPQSAPERPAAAQRTASNKEDLPPGVTQKRLPVTLEDICLGANKKVRYKRRVPDEMGIKLVEDTKILTVQVYPGLKPGSRIKHPDEGDYNPETGRLGEVWFLLVEQDHDRFERRDRDLHLTIDIPLGDALCGWSRTVRSVCGKDIKVKHSGPTKSGWRDYYAGLGMPKYDRENKEQGGPRGDMVIEARIVMPPRLEDWQKDMIRRALPSGPSR
jgi:hypothetical protein